jgi:hypothetical protein
MQFQGEQKGLVRQKGGTLSSLNLEVVPLGTVFGAPENGTVESSSQQEFGVNESNDQSYTILQAASISAKKGQ